MGGFYNKGDRMLGSIHGERALSMLELYESWPEFLDMLS